MLIRSKNIYTEDGLIDGWIEVENGRIKSITDDNHSLSSDVLVATNLRVLPGIIDIHTHGGGGWVANYLGNTKNKEEVRSLAKHYASKGIAGFMATPALWSVEKLCETLEGIADVIDHQETRGSKILGIHLEGPFFNHSKAGAGFQTPDWMPLPTQEVAEKFVNAARGHLRYITMAPELEGSETVIKYLNSVQVRVAAGHTNATSQELKRAIDWGVKTICHSGNAISMIHQRAVGVLGGLILDSRVYAEVICDFIHLCPEFVSMMIKCKGIDKICMISDSSNLAGVQTGVYDVEPRVVELKESGVINIYGSETIAGSSLYVIDGIKNLETKLHVPMSDIIKMCALNPAKVFGMSEDKGSIKVGKFADFTVIDEEYNVVYTVVEGKIVYDAKFDDDCTNKEFLMLRRAETC